MQIEFVFQYWSTPGQYAALRCVLLAVLSAI